ncbi:hypothetical protein Fot_39402 [Forsythia ovata]|uniref:Uncharacterized protein n=1 Tax=Forsythia ovata TaxID=205694 RepID=A0ABD1S4N5_9LAMI
MCIYIVYISLTQPIPSLTDPTTTNAPPLSRCRCRRSRTATATATNAKYLATTQTTHRHPHGEPSEPTAYLPYLPVSPPFLQHKQPTDILTVNPANPRRRTHPFSSAYLPTPANPPPFSQ